MDSVNVFAARRESRRAARRVKRGKCSMYVCTICSSEAGSGPRIGQEIYIDERWCGGCFQAFCKEGVHPKGLWMSRALLGLFDLGLSATSWPVPGCISGT